MTDDPKPKVRRYAHYHFRIHRPQRLDQHGVVRERGELHFLADGMTVGEVLDAIFCDLKCRVDADEVAFWRPWKPGQRPLIGAETAAAKVGHR